MTEQSFGSESPAPVSWVAGEPAAADLYIVYSEYKSVEDLDGSFVTVEMAFPAPVYATEILPDQRGNLVLAAGSPVTDEVAAVFAG